MPHEDFAGDITPERAEKPAHYEQGERDSDWSQTIAGLMSLAKQNNRAYEYEKAIHYLSTLEELWDSKGPPEFTPELRFELHREKGKAFASQGKYDEAIAEYQKILRLCRDSTELQLKAEIFAEIGQLLAKQGDHDRALGYLQRAIGAYRRLKNRAGLCRALRNLGVVFVELGEFEEAELNYQEAINLARECGEQTLCADLLNNLGAIMNMKGIHGRALDLYNCALEIYRLASLTRKSAYTMNNLAITLAEMGRNDEAFDYFKQAGQIAATIQDASLTLIVDINLADLHLKKGAVAAAKEHCQKAESYLRESGLINGHLVETKKIAGKIALEEGDFETAFNCFNLAIEISRQIGARYLEAEALMERGRLCKALKRNMEALTDLEASYRIYHSLQAEGKRENTEAEINSIENLYLQIFYSMSHEVDRKDPYTKGHSDRVAALGLLLGKQLELPVGTLKTLVAAALLHDIGKIKIDDEVLKKAGKLTPQEFDDIKRHPALGVGLLRGKEFPWDIRPLILHHHEKLDGSGYPLGLKGDDIPTGAKILCIADVFDALTSDRVYRPAYDPETALKMMEAESGSAYDPAFLKCFAAMIRQGLADQVINSHTQDDELFSIWSQCMAEDKPEIPKAKENPAEAHKSPAVAGLSAPANK